MTKYGYARYNNPDEHDAQQEDKLRAAGCTEIITDKGASPGPNWLALIDPEAGPLRDGDEVIIVDLARVGRKVEDVKNFIESLWSRGIMIDVLDASLPTGPARRFLLETLLLFVIQSEGHNPAEVDETLSYRDAVARLRELFHLNEQQADAILTETRAFGEWERDDVYIMFGEPDGYYRMRRVFMPVGKTPSYTQDGEEVWIPVHLAVTIDDDQARRLAIFGSSGGVYEDHRERAAEILRDRILRYAQTEEWPGEPRLQIGWD